jgi:peptide/nickel transport system substrate-binding protein
MTIARRSLLRAGAAAAGLTAIGRVPATAQAAKVVKFVPSSDLAGIDPIWTTGYVVRNHGYNVYDTLYATDGEFRIQPQMAEGHEVSADGLTWSIRLREGLRFHDNEPARARDCIASIRRWAARDGLGQMLMNLTDELAAVDDRTLRFRLKSPFPMLVAAIGKLSAPVPFMMPERMALTDPNTQIRDATGSGPLRFLASEWVPGSHAAYAKFDGYVPRAEAPSGTAGGKRINVDRVEWITIPDSSTAMAALQTGNVDWLETPSIDLLPLAEKNSDIVVTTLDDSGYPAILRFNHLQPPFDNVKARQAVLAAVQQAPYMQAAIGNLKYWRECKSFFPCGTPMSSGTGSEAMAGDLSRAKQLLTESGYSGGKVVLLAATDNPILNALSMVTADLLKKLDMNVELVATDWGTLLQRRASQEPVEKGGWSLFHTSASTAEYMSPAAHLGLRSDGRAAWAGWPTDPKMEELRKAWIFASSAEAQRTIGAEIEQEAFRSVPYVPLGQYNVPTAYRRTITDVLRSSAPLFWNLHKA